MDTKNPENPQVKHNIKKKMTKKDFLQNPINYINQNQLNTSASKMQYTFSKSDRFSRSSNSITADKFYDLPPVLKTQRSSSFGYGNKIDFGKNCSYTPSPANYQILRDFQGNSKQGSTMGLSRELIKFNDLFNTNKDTHFPEPASYNLYFKDNSHRITIGQRFSQKKKWIDCVPGPGNYNHQEPTSKLKSTVSNYRSSPTAKFTKTERLKQLLSTNKLTPGPGNYKANLTSIKKDGTTFGRATREQKSLISKTFSPGPGAYQMFSQFLH